MWAIVSIEQSHMNAVFRFIWMFLLFGCLASFFFFCRIVFKLVSLLLHRTEWFKLWSFIFFSVAVSAAVVVTRTIRIGKQNEKQVECVFNFRQPKYSARVRRREVISIGRNKKCFVLCYRPFYSSSRYLDIGAQCYLGNDFRTIFFLNEIICMWNNYGMTRLNMNI